MAYAYCLLDEESKLFEMQNLKDVCVHMYMFAYLYICMYECVHVYTCICVYVYQFVYLCKCLFDKVWT